MKKLIAVVAALLALGVAHAQSTNLKVSTGSTSGTYYRMFTELNEKCANTGLTFTNVQSSGSVENLNRIIGNEVNAGFVQTDVIFLRSQNENLSNIKTLIAFHPEEVHFIAKAGRKVGGTMGIGGQPLTNVEQLGGLKVGAAGGSFISAQVVRLQSEIPFNILQFDDNTKLIAALNDGSVDVAVMVGGSPLKAVSDLDASFTLLTITPATAAKLKAVYNPAVVTYPKLNSGRTVQTIATDALLVTREYKTERMVNGLAALRSCFAKNLDEMKETTGTHPKWQAVNASNQGKWAYYQLPEAQPARPISAKK